jgi:hypothetical protein
VCTTVYFHKSFSVTCFIKYYEMGGYITFTQKTHFISSEEITYTCNQAVSSQVTHSRQASADSVFRLCSRRRCPSTLVLDANVLLQKSQGKGLSPATHKNGLRSTVQQIMLVYECQTHSFLAWDSLTKHQIFLYY